MEPTFTIGNEVYSKFTKPYLIAEIGVNHEGSMDLAKMLIDQARLGGANAAKFQTYKAETIASKNSPSYWDLSKEKTTSQYELFKKYDKFGENEYIELAEYCMKVGIDFLSTPFDDNSLDFLTPLMKVIKISSSDLTNIPFLRKVARKNLPVILSTGASSLDEVREAVKVLQSENVKDLSLLHCILNYPTNDENANLGMIESLKREFPNYLVGYSDHTLPSDDMFVLTSSYILGARIIEKHFTHDKNLPGNDHYHAMDKQDCHVFCNNIARYIEIQGSFKKQPLRTEQISRENARRSIVVKGNVSAGEVISEKNITYKRPAHGISPLHWDDVIGKKAVRDLRDDELLNWKDIE